MINCAIINVVTPENVVSDLLTVDRNNCEAACTVNGTARWTNNGGTVSVPTDLKITVNGSPTILATGVIIGPGTSTAIYPFIISSLVKGVYTISTIPSGATDQIITVINPAHIVAKTISSNTINCTTPCPSTISVTWENTGDVGGVFTPAIILDGITRYELPLEALAGNTISSVKIFNIPNLGAGIHTVCPDPNP